MRMGRTWLVIALALLCIPVARADLVWSYSYSGGGVSGSGYLTTSDTTSGGAYTITGISGLRGTVPLERLLAPGTYSASGGGILVSDNLLNAAAPFLGFGGFTAQVGTDLVNVYYLNGDYHDIAGVDCPAASCGDASHLGTVVNFTASLVPSLEWSFSYAGSGVSASGTLLTLATPVAGHYEIVGLSGARNGDAMNALFPAGTYGTAGGGILISDNLLFPNPPFLDFGGFTFHAGSDRYNVYYLNGQYYDIAGADCPAANCGDANHLGTPIDFAVAQVPEPGSIALVALALFALAHTARRRRGLRRNSIRR